MRQVLLIPGEAGGWIAEVPSLPGCFSFGDTRDQALDEVRDAIGVWIDVMREKGEPVPEDPMQAELVAVDEKD